MNIFKRQFMTQNKLLTRTKNSSKIGADFWRRNMCCMLTQPYNWTHIIQHSEIILSLKQIADRFIALYPPAVVPLVHVSSSSK